jgi:membrane protein DedA with SNARE-associated domain
MARGPVGGGDPRSKTQASPGAATEWCPARGCVADRLPGQTSAMTPALPGPLAPIGSLLDHYGYGAVALLVLLDNACVPVPGQTVLIAAAVFAGAGQLNLALVVVIALAAAIAGTSLGYLLGRTGGRALVHRYGRYVLLTPERFARGEEFFIRNGGRVVTVARFIDGLRQTGGLLAGITEMRLRRFLACTTLGAVLWVGLWVSVGDLAGAHLDAIYTQVVRYQLYLLLALAVAAAFLLLRHLRRVRHPPAAAGRHRRP